MKHISNVFKSRLKILFYFVFILLFTSILTANEPTTKPIIPSVGVELGKTQQSNPKLDKAEFKQKTANLRMPFIANNGQMDGQVKFYAETFGGTVFVTKEGEIVYVLPNNSSELKAESLVSDVRMLKLGDGRQEAGGGEETLNSKFTIQNLKSGVALKEELVGGKVSNIKGEEKAVTKVSYFRGNEPSKWKTNISTYNVVTLGEVYKGIELKLKAYGNNIEKLFTVKPDADTETIQLKLSGAKALKINKDGQLEVRTELGTVKFTKPVAYQEIDGKRVEVEVEYSIQNPEVRRQEQELPNKKSVNYNRTRTNNPCSKHTGTGFVHATPMRNPKSAVQNDTTCHPESNEGSLVLKRDSSPSAQNDSEKSIIQNLSSTPIGDRKSKIVNHKCTYGFKAASYDKSKPLIIDPLLASTYLGGSDWDCGYSLILDTSGNVYVTGQTRSMDFPTTSGVYDTSFNDESSDSDVFISKLDGGLTSLLASTYLGGEWGDDGYSLTLDTSGNVYVTGKTESEDFPTTNGAYDAYYNYGSDDVFVSKLNSELTNLLASTYLGGHGEDKGSSITVDTNGYVYVTGNTSMSGFPTTSGAYDTSYNGGDVFVSKLNSELSSLLASTYLGGSGYDTGDSLALDTSGNVYVTGETRSEDFPTTSGAYDTSFNGGDSDVFVSKLNSGLSSLLASTYLGGSDFDYGKSLAVALDGNVYVTGWSKSEDFPTTSGAYDTSVNSYGDVFLSKLDSGLTSLQASTCLGGSSGSDIGKSIALDTSGNVYVTGYTYSTDFPTTSGAYDTSRARDDDYATDVFVSKLNSGLTNLLASTYLSGHDSDNGYSLSLDTSGNVYVTGETGSNFPTTSGAYDTSFNYSWDVFVSKLDSNLSASTTTPTPTSTATKTPTPTPTPTPTATPAPCEEATDIIADPSELTLQTKTSDTITVTVTGEDGCPVKGDSVRAKVEGSGNEYLKVSPKKQVTNASGKAVFTVKGKSKAGNAKVTFKDVDLSTQVNVTVVK